VRYTVTPLDEADDELTPVTFVAGVTQTGDTTTSGVPLNLAENVTALPVGVFAADGVIDTLPCCICGTFMFEA
jgi:hypothetical protein